MKERRAQDIDCLARALDCNVVPFWQHPAVGLAAHRLRPQCGSHQGDLTTGRHLLKVSEGASQLQGLHLHEGVLLRPDTCMAEAVT